MSRTSFPRHKIRITLLENIHPAAREALVEAGYTVDVINKALEGDELAAVIAESHVIGLRSRTKLRAAQIELGNKLLAIGCFSVGTDQVDIAAAGQRGIPVFNAPHASTRSVAELTMGCVIALARRLGDKSQKLHCGQWDKSLAGAHEVRGRCIGLIGYGHIGQQVGLLAEAFGMRVLFHDIQKKLPLGLARPLGSVDQLLDEADFVSLHVPDTSVTRGMIGAPQLARIKRGGYLINHSRGSVVAIDALVAALKSGHLGGAALDVFPQEPTPVQAEWHSELEGIANVLMTPHVGGNTEEAQRNIGLEVARSIVEFVDRGSTEGAVNFPAINLPPREGTHRILHIHKNVPGVLASVTAILSELGANIEAQQLGTTRDIGYLVMDVDRQLSDAVHERIAKLPVSVKTRILY
ncbi:MAG: phosphoglycerate dehydrogenase [Planctomycetes bacterium]|jgi:D-3-phosphoglycerate dehydrogenase|nr:phosphoglycerate dehydrogenase [Planctomycetota bacterium]